MAAFHLREIYRRRLLRARTNVTVFGPPVRDEHDLVLVEGHRYGKRATIHNGDIDDVTDLEG